jgi:hypothetical protein
LGPGACRCSSRSCKIENGDYNVLSDGFTDILKPAILSANGA